MFRYHITLHLSAKQKIKKDISHVRDSACIYVLTEVGAKIISNLIHVVQSLALQENQGTFIKNTHRG